MGRRLALKIESMLDLIVFIYKTDLSGWKIPVFDVGLVFTKPT